MTTLILRSTCLPLGDSRNNAARGGQRRFGSVAAVGTDDVGRGSFARTSSSTGSVDSTTTGSLHSSQYRSSAHGQNIHGASHTSHPLSIQRDHEYISSLPLQCDVTLVPRIPINDDPPASPSDHNDWQHPSFAPSPTSQPKLQHLRTLRMTKQHFLPCGTNNFIAIDKLPVYSTTASNGGGGTDYLLSLANCQVDLDHGESSLVLPVTASPSTFQFSFDSGNDDSSLWGEDDTIHYPGGNVHREGNVHASFDYSAALELYRESIGKRRNEGGATCASTNNSHDEEQQTRSAGSNNATSSSWNPAESSTRNNADETKKSEVASIMQTLEDESRFIKKTLAALGCMGIFVMVALAWTLWKMTSSRGKQQQRSRRTRRVRVVNVVPRDIGAVERRSGRAAENAAANDSMQGHDQNVISPLPMAANEIQRSNDINDNGGGGANRNNTPMVSPDDEGSAAQKKSPRHWYEGMLAPSPADGNNRHDSTLPTNNEDVARSPFSPLLSSIKGETTTDVTEVPEKRTASVGGRNAPRENRSCHPPRELIFDTPMRSEFSPPPSDVNLLQLSNRIQSSTSSDASEVDDESIEESSPKVGDLAGDEPQAKEEAGSPGGESAIFVKVGAPTNHPTDASSLSNASNGSDDDFPTAVTPERAPGASLTGLSTIDHLSTEVSIDSDDIGDGLLAKSDDATGHKVEDEEQTHPEIIEEEAATKNDGEIINFPPKIKLTKDKSAFAEELVERATPTTNGNDFASSLAKKSAEVKTKTPKPKKKKTLTPQPLRSTPESTLTGSASDEFLADYWE